MTNLQPESCAVPTRAPRKNRPLWALPRRHGPKHPKTDQLVAKRTRWGDFSPGSGRVQCEKIARSTKQRCRQDALQGAKCCRLHGGHNQAYRSMVPGTISLASGRSVARVALAKRGSERMPKEIEVWPLSPVDRGRLIEAYENRLMSPSAYSLALTARTSPKQEQRPAKNSNKQQYMQVKPSKPK